MHYTQSLGGAAFVHDPPHHKPGVAPIPMDLSASERLTDLEDKMVKAIDSEWTRWEESGGPLPSALVMLLDKAHRAIFSRVGKTTGMDLNEMMRNPESGLVELDKRKALILKLMEQRSTSRANVLPFPTKETSAK